MQPIDTSSHRDLSPDSRVVFFRVDASDRIGLGHLMRCLALASRLKAYQFKSIFLMRSCSNSAADLVRNAGHQFRAIEALQQPPSGASGPLQFSETQNPVPTNDIASPFKLDQAYDAQQADAVFSAYPGFLLVIDHYGIDSQWVEHLKSNPSLILVIDDLADREQRCDILMDQTIGRTASDYAGLIPEGAECLPGTQYALLRPEFAYAREKALAHRREINVVSNILINFGGTLQTALIDWCIKVLEEHFSTCCFDIRVIGDRPLDSSDEDYTRQHKIQWLGQVDNMAEQICRADIAIGAAGTSAWERCALALPSLMFVLASNQSLIAENLHATGAAICCGDITGLADYSECETRFVEGLRHCLVPEHYALMSQQAALICDGKGCDRVVNRLLASL